MVWDHDINVELLIHLIVILMNLKKRNSYPHVIWVFSLISNTYYFNINIHILIIITFLTSPLMASLLVEDNSLPDFTESRLDSASWLISSDRSTDMELLRTSSVSERLWWRVWLDSDLDALPMLDLCSYQGKAGKLQKIKR